MRVLVAAAVASLVAACSSPNERVTQFQFASSRTLATTGNLRLVTERDRPGFLPVVCTEPSPDYAVAFGSNGSLNAKVTVPQGASGEGQGSFARTEQVTQLAGREAAVLALRDGLYAACQSYANGTIGHDAYAMILSQYGALLVALVGNEGTGTAGHGGNPTRQATLSALVVACISGHDNTRQAPLGPPNALLNARFCRTVLDGALRRSLRS